MSISSLLLYFANNKHRTRELLVQPDQPFLRGVPQDIIIPSSSHHITTRGPAPCDVPPHITCHRVRRPPSSVLFLQIYGYVISHGLPPEFYILEYSIASVPTMPARLCCSSSWNIFWHTLLEPFRLVYLENHLTDTGLLWVMIIYYLLSTKTTSHYCQCWICPLDHDILLLLPFCFSYKLILVLPHWSFSSLATEQVITTNNYLFSLVKK